MDASPGHTPRIWIVVPGGKRKNGQELPFAGWRHLCPFVSGGMHGTPQQSYELRCVRAQRKEHLSLPGSTGGWGRVHPGRTPGPKMRRGNEFIG